MKNSGRWTYKNAGTLGDVFAAFVIIKDVAKAEILDRIAKSSRVIKNPLKDRCKEILTQNRKSFYQKRLVSEKG